MADQSAGAPGASSAPEQTSPLVRQIWAPKTTTFKPPKELVEEILQKVGDPPKLSNRLRKAQEGYEMMENKRMRAMDYEGDLMREVETKQMEAAAEKAAAATAAPIVPAPLFRTGQSVLHWWAGWFESAEKPVMQLQGGPGGKKGRPAWFDADIVAALEPKATRYAGHQWPVGHVYQVH